MGILQKLFKGGTEERREFKQRFKEAQQDDKIAEMVAERKKSSNLRELEKYHRDKQEEMVKQALDKIHKEQTTENWKSKNSILAGGTSILKDDRPILKEKNIFANNKNIFTPNKKYSMGL